MVEILQDTIGIIDLWKKPTEVKKLRGDLDMEILLADVRYELAGIEYPQYFIDFESLYGDPSVSGPVALSQIPFQWSVHRRCNAWVELERLEFLADDELDPRTRAPGYPLGWR